MKRYTSLLALAIMLLVVVLTGSAYLARADTTGERTVRQTLTVYTTLPAETASLIAQEYERASHVRLNFVPLASEGIMARLRSQTEEEPSTAALVLADSQLLTQAAKENLLAPYMSERSDSVAENMKNSDGYWTGVWYDPVVFAANRDYLATCAYVPDTWAGVAAYPGLRLAITDFPAAEASSNLLYALIANYGEVAAYDLLRQFHPKVVQYAKYLSTPVRMAGMGEADFAVAVESEALRYINNGYPLTVIYPADGTAYMLTGAAVCRRTGDIDAALAHEFMDWLLTDEPQIALQRSGFYFAPTNPDTLAHKMVTAKNLTVFKGNVGFTAAEKRDFLDRWVKYIRFAAN